MLQQESNKSNSSSGGSSIASASNSISLIKLDELSSFGATKQSRLPALIKLTSKSEQENQLINSMPTLASSPMGEGAAESKGDAGKQASLPVEIALKDKENHLEQASDDFQMINMDSTVIPEPSNSKESRQTVLSVQNQPMSTASNSNLVSTNQPPSQLGDSLIDLIINLKNENQNLVKALETNNDYVKERLSEFKRITEESKKREAQFAMDKAEHEHQVRKLQRQNMVLSERLKSMEAKLKDMKMEVDETLNAASSSKASSIRGEQNMYPDLNDMQMQLGQNNTETMQIDAASAELHNDGKLDSFGRPTAPSANEESMPEQSEARKVSTMTKEELSKRFDADKAEFYANQDDPMKQCDKLEKQLNDIGRRDYEICLLQQQLNIYRQDFRLERMANLEAKIQIEKLKNDIDRLCYERLREKDDSSGDDHDYNDADNQSRAKHQRGSGVKFSIPGPAVAAADAVISKLGGHLSRKAARSAAKAAKYASKQAHREEKAAMAAAAAAAAASSVGPSDSTGGPGAAEHHHHRGSSRRHHHHHPGGRRSVKSEVVNDLLSTANKAMLTGYKMASTHVNLALDKLSQYEQQQARNLATDASSKSKPSAPEMGPPSVD